MPDSTRDNPVVAQRIVLLTDGYSDPVAAKTATGLLRYRSADVVAVLDRQHAGKSASTVFDVGGDIPIVATLEETPDANTLLVGVAPSGGRLPPDWRSILLAALDRGWNVVSGLHDYLCEDAELAAAAAKSGARLIDVRKNDCREVAQHKQVRDGCLRIHTVGNDCGVGKKVVAIELTRALTAQGVDAKFIATGQTGIMIEGNGCPVDSVVADFVSGAVEQEILAHQHHDVLVIEGQGSLAHPRYSAVSLGLLHGCTPQGLVLCYEAGRTHVHGMPHMPLCPLDRLRDVYETMAGLIAPARVIAVAMNGRRLSPATAQRECDSVTNALQLPVWDVLRQGVGGLVDVVLNEM